MASFGRTDFAAFNTTLNRCDFTAWIARCKRSAPGAVVFNDSVIDQDAFTAHCWAVAQTECLVRFAA